LVHFDTAPTGSYGENEPVGLTIFKVMFLVASLIWSFGVVLMGHDHVRDSLANNLAGGVIYEISRLSVLLADMTAWAAIPVLVFGGGSLVFISIAKLLRKMKPLLDKIS
jgi:hypothetical protein